MIRRLKSFFVFESELDLLQIERMMRAFTVGIACLSILCLLLPGGVLGIGEDFYFRFQLVAMMMVTVSLLVLALLRYRHYYSFIVTCFLVVMVLAILASTELHKWDEPHLLLPLVIPIVLAPLLAPPAISLLVAFAVSAILYIADQNHPEISIFGSIQLSYFFTAILASLVSHALRQYVREVEQKTRELEIANRSLDEKRQQLQAAMDELVAATQTRETVLSTIGHDLRSPLAVIIGYAELLRRRLGDQLDNDNREVLEVVCANGRHLMALMDDMLNISKIQAGKLVLQPEPIDGFAILEQVVRSHRRNAEEKGLCIQLEASPLSSPLQADPVRFTQVMTNLVSNAVKYTSEGKITVRLQEEHGNGAFISVMDTGEGIPEENLPSIFEPFSQTDRSQRRYDSTGLGLSIVKYLTEAHGGQIEVDSTVGVGTTFRLRWPLAAAADGNGVLEKENGIS